MGGGADAGLGRMSRSYTRGVRPDPAALWDLAVPARPGLPGVSMAGFTARDPGPVDLAVVPYPAVTLIVDLRDTLTVDDVGDRHRGSVVAGLPASGIRGQGRGIECLQVRLSPVAAYALLGGAVELDGRVTALADVLPGAERLEDRLRSTPSWRQRFAVVEEALARSLARRVDPEVGLAWRAIGASSGLVRVDRIAAETGWSRQRLWSRFRSQLGLTPKRAARLVRFDEAAHRLAAGRSPADVAAELGYADQSHLHREVRDFTGATPARVAAAAWLAVDDVAWRSQPHPARRRR